jgi:hypothetical protein
MRNDATQQICPQGGHFALEQRSAGLPCAGSGEDFVLQTGAVAVTRARDWCGIFRSIKVLLGEDEHEVGAVPYGERRVFQLPPGVHSLSIGMDWGRSPPYEVEVRPGQLIELEGSIRWRGFLYSVSLFAAFIMPGRMFMIRPLAGRGNTRFQAFWEGGRIIIGEVVFFGLVFLLLFLFASFLL